MRSGVVRKRGGTPESLFDVPPDRLDHQGTRLVYHVPQTVARGHFNHLRFSYTLPPLNIGGPTPNPQALVRKHFTSWVAIQEIPIALLVPASTRWSRNGGGTPGAKSFVCFK